MLVCHFQGREGVVKQIYRGTVFIYNEAEQENSGYFCCKSQNCEKFKVLGDACKEKVCMFVTYDYLIYPTPQISSQKNKIILRIWKPLLKHFHCRMYRVVNRHPRVLMIFHHPQSHLSPPRSHGKKEILPVCFDP